MIVEVVAKLKASGIIRVGGGFLIWGRVSGNEVSVRVCVWLVGVGVFQSVERTSLCS